ncbi:hypothetical protein CYMTET_48979 [Cymbomonas tetramitiformis]|uniref:Uncharacterized protein n=1 Tax=Cymbomonas tetramitiformis TaxID=36881 RepID=A0AAE0BR36_9CHLO|nr:hypothetical protein CYMTET_48979 [Cymbomonas tetramitiformis]
MDSSSRREPRPNRGLSPGQRRGGVGAHAYGMPEVGSRFRNSPGTPSRSGTYTPSFGGSQPTPTRAELRTPSSSLRSSDTRQPVGSSRSPLNRSWAGPPGGAPPTNPSTPASNLRHAQSDLSSRMRTPGEEVARAQTGNLNRSVDSGNALPRNQDTYGVHNRSTRTPVRPPPPESAEGGDTDRSSHGAAEPPPDAPSSAVRDHRFSTSSNDALCSLAKFERMFEDIKGKVDTFEKMITGHQSAGVERDDLAKAKSELAQLNGKLEKLQLEGIDSVTVGELCSGKEEARAKRKQLNRDIDVLFPRMGGLNDLFAVELKKLPVA